MQDKQKVTLYLSPELHRQLKIRAAVDAEPMSAIAEKALVFYLDHPDVVDELEADAYGSTYQVYDCPDCHSALVFNSGEVTSLKYQPSVLTEELPVQPVTEELVAARV